MVHTMVRKTWAARLVALAATLLVASSIAPSGLTVAGTLPNGTSIEVAITHPVTGTVFVTPVGVPVDVVVAGTAAVGEGDADATLIVVIDVSDSTSLDAGGAGCGGDQNGDGDLDTRLACEVAAVLALDAAAASKGSVDEMGAVVFGTGAAADMTPGGGDDPIAAPGPDFETVVRSAHYGWDHTHISGVHSFTEKLVGGGSTNYAAALESAETAISASTNSVNIVVFLSDGESNTGGGSFAAELQDVVDTGAIVHTFAVGAAASCAGGSAGTLQEIADQTGGICTKVEDPSTLPDIVPILVSTTLDALDLGYNGNLPAPIPATDISMTLPLPGADNLAFATPQNGLGPGSHTFCVTATGTDGGGSGDVTDCVTGFVVSQVAIDIKPSSCPDPINTGSQGLLPVAIAGTAALDVTTIDPTTVRLEGVPAVRWSYEDAATPFSGAMRSADDCTTKPATARPTWR